MVSLNVFSISAENTTPSIFFEKSQPLLCRMTSTISEFSGAIPIYFGSIDLFSSRSFLVKNSLLQSFFSMPLVRLSALLQKYLSIFSVAFATLLAVLLSVGGIMLPPNRVDSRAILFAVCVIVLLHMFLVAVHPRTMNSRNLFAVSLRPFAIPLSNLDTISLVVLPLPFLASLDVLQGHEIIIL